MAEIDSSMPLSPILPRRSTRKVDEEERARDERQRRQQQEKHRLSRPAPSKHTENGRDDNRPLIDEYV